MSRKFIRGFWGTDDKFWESNPDYQFPFGEFDKKERCATRRRTGGLDGRVKALFNDNFTKIEDQMVYVYGKDNGLFVKSLNIPCKTICDLPFKFHPIQKPWLHKLEILKVAMEEYDEIIWLDFDCMPLKAIDDKLWDTLRAKDSFQAPLRRYKHVQNNLRQNPNENKILPNGGFVYIRDKSIPTKLLDIFYKLNSWTDEIAYAKYTDDLIGKFDMDQYLIRFEPDCVVLEKGVYRGKPKIDPYFKHR